MPFIRRRPLARAAVVGGAGYAIGKSRARAEQERDQSRHDAPPPPEPERGGLSEEAYQELERLARLKEQGILTPEEFDAQKAKILAGP